jgi:hypothetical protein
MLQERSFSPASRTWIIVGSCGALFAFCFVVSTAGFFAWWYFKHDNRTMGNLVQHFQANGLDGKYRPTMAALINAKESGVYEGSGFSAEIFLFHDAQQARSVEQTGFNGPCVRNGNFILVPIRGGDMMIPAFQKF